MIPDHNWINGKDHAAMIKALAQDEGAKRAFQYLIKVLCEAEQVPLVPGSPDETAFNAGRQWVGRQLQQAVSLPIEHLVEVKHERTPARVITASERRRTAARTAR